MDEMYTQWYYSNAKGQPSGQKVANTASNSWVVTMHTRSRQHLHSSGSPRCLTATALLIAQAVEPLCLYLYRAIVTNAITMGSVV